jgi:hypothetical protein
VENVRDDESSDEEGGMGIRMVDNDDAAGGLEYCDPAALEEGSRWR